MTKDAFDRNRGDVTIYVALVFSFIIITVATILGATLAKQIRLTNNVESSERAFYAANSGLEEAFYMVSKSSGGSFGPEQVEGEIDYDGGIAEYSGEVSGKPDEGRVCVEAMVGKFHAETRKLGSGSGGC